MISTEQKVMAMVAHGSYLLGGLGIVFVPFVLWMANGRQTFAGHHARQACLLQLVVMAVIVLICVVCGIFAVAGADEDVAVLIGIAGCGTVGIGWLVLSIIPIVQALEGKMYEYPLPGLLTKKCYDAEEESHHR